MLSIQQIRENIVKFGQGQKTSVERYQRRY